MTVLDALSLHTAFNKAMDRLDPFEPRPALAAAVSGGADSMALAVLAHDWVRRRQGTLLALVVDHGLRPGSAAEARLTISRLGRLGIAATLLTLTTLRRGPALAERARIMRYDTLSAACRSAGSLHLLLGHHAGDQAETLMMRVLGSSLTHGLAGMPAVLEHAGVRLLRPLLAVEPAALRALLQASGVDWAEDPSNFDLTALRPRLRHLRAVHWPGGGAAVLTSAARAAGGLRAHEEAAAGAELARRVEIRPEGFAMLSPGRVSAAALSGLIRTIGGARYAASTARMADLAAQPRPATVAGVRLLAAGRIGQGLLLVREEAAIGEPVDAHPNAVWDGRFRLIATSAPPSGMLVGKLGEDAARFRRHSTLPSAVLRTLPAMRLGEMLAAVPHLGYVSEKSYAGMTLLFSPPKPVGGSCFMPA